MLNQITDLVDGIISKVEDSAFLQSIALLLGRIAVFFPFHNSGLIKYNDWLNTGFSPNAFSITVYQFDPANGEDAFFAVPGLDPVLGAYMATFGEMVLPFLVLIGIAGRVGAVGLLIMTVVIQFVAWDSWEHHIWWATCLAFVALKGPGLISVDHFIRQRFMGR